MSRDDLPMPITDHLSELRKRLLWSFGAIAGGFGAAYAFSKQLFALLTVPYNDAYRSVFGEAPKLITTGLVEAFLVYLKVGLVGGLFLASPVIVYQIWSFIAPGLHHHERRHVLPGVFLATLFFVGGAMLGYFGVFPLGFRYFLQVAPSDQVAPMVRMEEYFHLATWMLLVFGLVFEAPLLVLYLTARGILKPRQVVRPWRGIVIGLAIASAILTPADPVSMLLMFLPLLGLYGLTALISLTVAHKRHSQTPPV